MILADIFQCPTQCRKIPSKIVSTKGRKPDVRREVSFSLVQYGGDICRLRWCGVVVWEIGVRPGLVVTTLWKAIWDQF